MKTNEHLDTSTSNRHATAHAHPDDVHPGRDPRSILDRFGFRATSLLLSALVLVLLTAVPSMHAQLPIFGGFKPFSATNDGLEPGGTLLRDPNGNFYGTTREGGVHRSGVVFKMTPRGDVTIIHDFNVTDGNGANVDGAHPFGGLVLGTDNGYYGTTRDGGANGYGTVFRITLKGILTTIYSFSAPDTNGFNADGANPEAALVRGSDGDFYGTAFNGGVGGQGSVFKVTSSGSFTTLHSFSALDASDNNNDGAKPEAALIQGTSGFFYGTTEHGGVNHNGVVFSMNTNGLLIALHHFAGSASGDGATPYASLIQGGDSNLYGTTRDGGANDAGTIFKMTTNGSLTILHSFSELVNFQTNSDGAFPRAALVQSSSDSRFYGSTTYGGVTGKGTVFRIASDGTFLTLHTFGSQKGSAPSAGSSPSTALVPGIDGNFYGTTENGGLGYGIAYRITPGGVETKLHTFANSSTGAAVPEASLRLGSDGNLYGTTVNGGSEGAGTIFMITPARVLTVLHSFSDAAGEGNSPICVLAQGSDGSFYGTTSAGGDNGNGTVFKVTTDGTLTSLHQFGAYDGNGVNNDGGRPLTGLVRGKDGNFYGATFLGGAHKGGTVFKLTPAGVLTTLHSFSAVDAQGNNTDGTGPVGALIQATDGSFYGTASGGGDNHGGTVYSITSSGIFTTLYSFDLADANGHNAHGYGPYAGLSQGIDGNFYGTTYLGGSGGAGTVFGITPDGALNTIHTFSLRDGDGFNNDGANPPFAPLLQAADGSFYGTAIAGGVNGEGVVFRVTSAGAFTTLHSFGAINSGGVNKDGSTPLAGLVSGGDGNFYGTVGTGGVNGTGKIYKLTFAPIITSAATATATVGMPFSYQIAATHSPTAYGVLGLPPGLKVDANTGLISGTPTVSGTKMLTLKVVNGAGGDTKVLTLTIQQALPVITSPATATATVGADFTYQITATNQPTAYGVLGLRPGLTVNKTTGLISGNPTGAPGTYTLTLQAVNSTGKGTGTLTLKIK